MSYNIVQDYTEHKYIEHKFTLDCKKSQSQVSIPVRENDTAIKLFITLQDGREPFYIEDGCISAIFIKKSDGTICENACIIEDNRTIRYDFTEGTANVEGINDCEVRVYSADGTMLTSPRFIMVVTNRVLSDDKITEDERTIMDNILLSELGRATAENSREEEETVRRENEAKRVQAEGDREDTFSKKIDEINEKLAKENSLVFDTKEHLDQFIGGYESTKNLCPLPKSKSTVYYSLTHNDNGTFNFDVSHDIGIPDYFGTVTLEPGVYVFTRYNCEFYIGITYEKMIPISKPFEVTETTEYVLCSSGYAGDSFKNAWVQITKGESVPDEFIPYYAPYTREDGKTVNDLSPGDILLVSEEGVSDYWWDGNAIRPIEAQADQTFNPDSTNAQSGTAVAEALSGYVVAEVGKGLSSNDFTNEDKEKLYSALQNENIDQTYTPDSENAQSGKAVSEAVSDKQDSLVSGTNIKTINNQSILGSGNITIEDGKSAYEVAVDNGFEGTEIEWLESLKGEKGVKGDPGEPGQKGDKGDTGAPGADGANGKDGVSATHSWNGTVLSITSASGTSSADLKGERGSQGSPGEKGETGEAGKSAYAYAQDGGFSGTEAEFEKAIVDLAGESIPEYWLEELETKADAIQTAMEKAGRNKSAFLWYTDAHWANCNGKKSPMLLKYLYKNTPMNKVSFGGDIVGSSLLSTREEMKYLYEWRKAIKGLPSHHSVIGNHDNLSDETADYEDDNYRYAFLIAPEESSDMVMGGDFYYYIDNPCEKTRYLYLDSGKYTFTDDETEFIIGALASTKSGWHIVIISHIWWAYSSVSTPTEGNIATYPKKALDLFDAYNARQSGSITMVSVEKSYDFSSCGGKVEFCIGGHIHADFDIYSDGGIPIINTTSAANQNRNNTNQDFGELGTINESAVFGIIADYNSEVTKITVVGVGRGTSRVVRNSSVKVSSISDITYSGDTTVGATIDKSKFTFTVNYSNGTTDTITGATSVSPATIGVVGNNTVTISYTEGTTTVSGTTTIVGTPVPVANLLNLDRTYVSGAEGENIGAHFDTSKAYLNVAYGSGVFNAKSCTVSDITENGVTVKESGLGGVYVGYPIDASGLNTNNIRVTFDYSGTGKCRTYWAYISPSSGVASEGKPLFTNDSAGASGSADVTINRQGVDQIIIYFGSNTSGTKTYSNISVTAAD